MNVSGLSPVSSATNYDVTFTFFMIHDLSTSGSHEIVCLTAGVVNCDNDHAILGVQTESDDGGANQNLLAIGATNSAEILITVPAWHTVVIHHDSTAANCSLAVDGGSAQIFTCNVADTTNVYIGPQHFGATAATWAIGNLKF